MTRNSILRTVKSSRPLRQAGRSLAAQWHRVTDRPVADIRARRIAAVPLTFGSLVLLTFFHGAALHHAGARLVWLVGGIRADVPLALVAARLPLSMFVPAPDLPFLLALLQVAVVFALAERVLGAGHTAAVALLTTLAATLAVRLLSHLGPGHPLGLPADEALALDTGPSAAVVGLLICVAWKCRSPVLLTGTVAAMVLEVAVVPNIASRGHLVGITAALAYAAATRSRPAATA
ncbi:hypothetical protein [Streptomyces syringium]|uniref:hypothetical protein n=1 Tax=Streptomyces syringium TaxID=76729 RepID=UPI003435AEBB